MKTTPVASCLIAVAILAAASAAHAQLPAGSSGVATSIASSPPKFRVYNVDRRERNMRNLINALKGGPTLTPLQADHAYAELNAIQRREHQMRARTGGRLTVPIIRYVDARLNRLSRQLGLREPAY